MYVGICVVCWWETDGWLLEKPNPPFLQVNLRLVESDFEQRVWIGNKKNMAEVRETDIGCVSY